MTKETELEGKINAITQEKDILNTNMKSAQEALNIEIKNLETQNKSQNDDYEQQIEQFNAQIK